MIRENTSCFKLSDRTYGICDLQSHKIRMFSIKNNKLLWQIENPQFKYLKLFIETHDNKKLAIIGDELFMIFNVENKINTQKLFINKTPNIIFEDSKKNIWIGTNDGLIYYKNGDLNSLPIIIKHNPENIHSISSNNIQSIYEDCDGLIWIGTSEGGLNIYDPDENNFIFLNHYSDISLSSNSVWGIYQDKNELWIGTSNGLNQLTFENENISNIYSQKNKLIAKNVFTTSVNPNSICSNFITSIIKDKLGNYWFGSHDNGISIYNPKNKKWKQLKTKNLALKSDVIFNLMCTSDNKIWISTMSGVYCYDCNTEKITISIGLKEGLPSGYVISTFEDNEKTIWIATTGGIYHLKNTGEKAEIFKSETNNPKSLSYNIVTSFCQDSKGRIWIATLGGGINLFDVKSKIFKSFTTKNGLSNDIIYKIIEDKKNNLWITTNMGLARFNYDNQEFKSYTEKEGILSNEFSQNSGFINDKGEILLGSPEGLMIFNPYNIKNKYHEIPINISSLEINYIDQNYISGNEINLNNNDKTISFEFTSPDFKNKEKLHYAYQLEGFDNIWHEVSNDDRIASYTNLPFGNFIFKVRVKKSNEDWQKKTLLLYLNVIPPFWLTPWFIFIEVIALALLAFIITRYYTQRKLKIRLVEFEMQQKIYFERERISRDLHDNVGSHLTYIITTLDNISYKMGKGEKEITQAKITSLSDFSRSTMQELRESIWALTKEKVSLEELKDKINDYSSRMAFAGNMNFVSNYSSKNNITFSPSLSINIYRIIQEAINNSVKHSEAKKLTVSILENENKTIFIEVNDNGKGMDKNSISNGYGLKNMQNRVEEISGEINIESSEKGTKISFSIPYLSTSDAL